MWHWPAQENSTAQALPLLASLTGTPGNKFVWTLTGSRSTSTKRTYVVRLPPTDIVVVADDSPLSIGMDGALLFMDEFRLLKGEFDIALEGELLYFPG